MKIEQVVVYGSGPTGLLAAAVMKRMLGWRTGVVLIDAGKSEPRAWSARLAPALLPLAESFVLGEDDLMRECEGTFFCGTRYEGWSADGKDFVVPHSTPEKPIGLIPQAVFPLLGRGFSPVDLWSRSRARGNAGRFLSSYPELERFFDGDLSPKLVGGVERYQLAPSYGLHLDDRALAKVLRRHAASLGVATSDSPVAGVVVGSSGRIDSIQFEDGSEITADLYIDCSGDPESELFKAVGGRFVSSAGPLSCDRALVARAARAAEGPVPTTTAVRRTEAGWTYVAPLADSLAAVHAFDSSRVSDEDAVTQLTQVVGPSGTVSEVEIEALIDGAAEEAWVGNCVAVGHLASSVQDLMGNYWLEVAHQLGSLLSHMASGDAPAALASGYNVGVRSMHAALQDVVTAHVCCAAPHPTVAWQEAIARAQPSAGLAERLDAFESGMLVQSATGRSATAGRLPAGLLGRGTYAALLSGFGLEPKSYPALLDHLDLEPYGEYVRAQKLLAVKLERELPTHAEFLESLHGAALV